ncbi:T9SS type A sorting domain-containing protein [Mongoliitalea daihaiensis]|uniref:T9SS type A sorting domain-containing protein n=1 Tax=Mongoliitalea daihaiensis TaxID=2782006 RepID=UPI001F343603|nr:T9SS type A sorting domain-containing protein [Mongoliitalea daihaiensis]UJP64557.1 T9SS type A sorting domain-containing protein [Mongoliitalea daihaiensis]
MKTLRKHIGLIFLLLSISFATFGQFQQLPTPIPQHKKPLVSNQRVLEEALALPFWDDFSGGNIDNNKWINEGATQSFTVANAAPTIGVLLLDGVDERGAPYSFNLLEQGFADRITSRPINLSNISSTQSGTVFLSFYWQPGGKAEMPDFNDELSLQFLNELGEWIEVWSQRGELLPNQLFFTQELIQVTPDFQHENFQFRFSSRGRLSGPFDSWLIDYVYLNQFRNSNDIARRDRALTETNRRPLEKYSALPFFEYQRRGNELWNRTTNEFNNLNNLFSPMEFTVALNNRETGELVQAINTNTPINPVPLAFERRRIQSNEIGLAPRITAETDLELLTYLSTGDEFLFQIVNGDTIRYNTVDLRVNDTVRTVIQIRDFFAYDDGMVDYSAGINQRSGMLANRFEVSEPAYVKGISINFTNFAQSGRVLDLMVWNNLNQQPLFVQEVFIPASDEINEFSYFEFEENILVDDIFFVGFAQFTNEFIHVGLDKSFDNGREIFFNVSGSWQQNTIVEGSLMIRAHMSEFPIIEEQAELSPSPQVYPNPVSSKLHIDGKVDTIQVFDPFGRLLNLPQTVDGELKIINFEGMMKGIYLVNIFHNNIVETKRILVQ